MNDKLSERERLVQELDFEPDEIWLQIGDEYGDSQAEEDRTWCAEQINETDIRYILDKKHLALEQRVAEGDRLLLAAAMKYKGIEARLSKMEEALEDIAVNAVTLDIRQLAKEALAGGDDAS